MRPPPRYLISVLYGLVTNSVVFGFIFLLIATDKDGGVIFICTHHRFVTIETEGILTMLTNTLPGTSLEAHLIVLIIKTYAA